MCLCLHESTMHNDTILAHKNGVPKHAFSPAREHFQHAPLQCVLELVFPGQCRAQCPCACPVPNGMRAARCELRKCWRNLLLRKTYRDILLLNVVCVVYCCSRNDAYCAQRDLRPRHSRQHCASPRKPAQQRHDHRSPQCRRVLSNLVSDGSSAHM